MRLSSSLRVVVLLTLASLLPAAPAFAHAKLISTSPPAGKTVAAPAMVTLNFDDPVQLPPGSLRISGPQGRVVAVTPSLANPKTLDGSLPRTSGAGRYTVSWRIIADDGHIESGSFWFAVRAGATRTPAAAPIPSGSTNTPSKGAGAAEVVLTVLMSLITILAVGSAAVRLRKARLTHDV